MTGFEYKEFGNFVEIKFNGKSLTIRELTKIAEQMRVELLKYGIAIEIKDNGN